MSMNNKYTTHDEIYNRLSLVHKHKTFTPLEIAQWCSECAVEVIKDADRLESYTNIELNVTDLKALAPCNVYRILDVFDSNRKRIEYRYDGAYLDFHGSFFGTKAYINYLGVPMDPETGYPYIKKGQEKACQAYCVYKMYYEDFLTGKIDATRWGYITDEMHNLVAAAQSSIRHKDRKSLERINKVHAMIFSRPGFIQLYDNQFKATGNF